jgi:hypothetical protein
MFHPMNSYLLVEKIETEEEKKHQDFCLANMAPAPSKAHWIVKQISGSGPSNDYYNGKRLIVHSSGIEEVKLDGKILYFVPYSSVIAAEEEDF